MEKSYGQIRLENSPLTKSMLAYKESLKSNQSNEMVPNDLGIEKANENGIRESS